MTATRINQCNALMVMRELTTASQSIGTNNTGQQGSMALPIVTGYTCIGAVSTESSAWQLPTTKSFTTSSAWYWAVCNAGKWSGSYTVHVRLLYVRDDAL